MKQALTGIAVFLTMAGYSQITVEAPSKTEDIGKVKAGLEVLAELQRFSDSGHAAYVLSFRNQKYTTIKDHKTVAFNGENGVIDTLYKLFKSVFLEENRDNKDYIVQFKLGRYDASLSRYKSFGVTGAMFMVEEGYVILTEKQVDKLFGKKED